MGLREYEMMHRIIPDLIYDDLNDFVRDCKMIHAKKTAKYAIECIHGRVFDSKIAQMYLAEDFTGV